MKQWKTWLVLPPVILGIILFNVLVKSKKPPGQVEAKERIRAVRVIKAPVINVLPRAIAYGYVTPSQTWDAVAEVSGRIVEIHNALKKGNFVKKGQLLLKIDPVTYGLAKDRGKANVQNIDAQLKELEQRKNNTERLLVIEKKSLKLSAQELERKRDLFNKGYISKSDLEKEEKSYLAQQSSVNNLQNTLDLVPAQRKSLVAQKRSGISSLTDYQLNLGKTEIRAPFDCRISAVHVEKDQYAGPGTVLVVAEGIDSVEIAVKITPRSFSKLLPRVNNIIDLQSMDMNAIRKAIGISAIVRLPFFKKNVFWQGTFSRTSESIDISTGALTVYVTVDDPYKNFIPGIKPPLVKNMYCEVELSGRPVPEKIVIPHHALHDKHVYLVNKNNRLEIRPITILWQQGEVVVVKNGLQNGEQVIVTDLSPAISGMLLKPVDDMALLAQLKQVASGEIKIK
jgi:RND family efflux transporter MFP subunit